VVSSPAKPRVLIFDLERARGRALAARLRHWRDDVAVTLTASREIGRGGAIAEIDLAIICLADERFDGLAFGAELGTLFPWIEIVYWFDETRAAPFAAAARSVGIRRVIPSKRLAGWLEGALTGLTRMTRARREHLSAERTLPPLPSRGGGDDDFTTPLPEAERLFREAYLRQLLSRSANRTIAARRAGVPYTTFCSMLKKLRLI
jgi:hypothetical protein